MSRSSRPQAFIIREGYVDWWGLGQLPQYYCAYLPQYFEHSLFDHYQLDCPPDLAGAAEVRKSDFLAGRYCARKALIHIGGPDVPISIGPNRNPLWPGGVLGSISHTGQVATAIVGDNRHHSGVGIDLAPVICASTRHEIQALILTSVEQRLFKPGCVSDNEVFTILFSLKESFFKAAYTLVNRYFGFEAVSVIAIDWQNSTVSFRLNDTLHDRLRKGHVLRGRFRFIEEKLLATLVLLDR